MSWQKRLFIIFPALAGLGLVAAILIVARLDPEAIGKSLADQVAASSGLQVARPESIEIQFLPPGLILTGVALRDGKREILTVKRLTARIALLPLLREEVKLSSLSLNAPKLSVRRPLKGGEQPASAGGGASFPVGSIRVQNGAIQFLDEKGRTGLQLTDLDLAIDDLRRNEGGGLAFSGELHHGRIHSDRIVVEELSGTFVGDGGSYRFAPLHCRLFGSDAHGKFEFNRDGQQLSWRLKLAAEKLSLGNLSRTLAGQPLFEGNVAMQAELSGKGKGRIVKTLNGTVKISGKRIVQHGFDIDGFVRKIKVSRDINLVDIGAYAIAGPLGALATKGVDVLKLAWDAYRDEQQVIEELVCNWSIQNGVVQTEDVALRTRENRLALRGAINLSAGSYDGMTLGLLDDKGCARLTEKISGPLDHPTVEKAGIIGTLAGPLVGVLKQGWELLNPKDCTPFYQGEVKPPGKEKNE